jgi:hypothetical protein
MNGDTLQRTAFWSGRDGLTDCYSVGTPSAIKHEMAALRHLVFTLPAKLRVKSASAY